MSDVYMYTSKGYRVVEQDEPDRGGIGRCDDCGRGGVMVYAWDTLDLCNDCGQARSDRELEEEAARRKYEAEWIAEAREAERKVLQYEYEQMDRERQEHPEDHQVSSLPPYPAEGGWYDTDPPTDLPF